VVSDSGQKLRVKRFRQRPGDCAIAAAASAANYFNPDVEYRRVRRALESDGQGLYTPDIGTLLNRLGFAKVTIITADLDHFDYTWRDREKLLSELKHSKRYDKDSDTRAVSSAYVNFLTRGDADNNLILDHHFGNYIRKSIDDGLPCLISFNFNMFHELGKWGDDGKKDSRRGSYEQHEVLISGYDQKGVNIVDSHHELYVGRLKKYRGGRYKMSWETLMTVMGMGDVILPSGYSKDRVEDGMVQAK
jgi:hypothetical protein